LLGQGWVQPGLLDGWRDEAVREIEEAVAQAQREPAPDPFAEEWTALSTEHLIEGQE
jgi:hypothetical protein